MADDIEVVAGVGIDVTPQADGWGAQLRAATLPEAERVGREIAERMAGPIAERVAGAVKSGLRRARTEAVATATATGRAIGDRMGQEIRDRIRAALRTAIRVEIAADAKEIDEVAAKVAALSGQRVEVTVKADVTGETEVRSLETSLTALNAIGNIDIRVDADVGQANTEITDIGAKVAALAGTVVDVKIKVKVTGTAALTRMTTELTALNAIAGDITIEVKAKVSGASAITRLATEFTALRAIAGNITINITATVSGLSDVRRMATAATSLRAAAGGRIDIVARARVRGPLNEVNELARSVRSLQRAGNPLRITIVTSGVLGAMRDIHTVNAFARTLGTLRPTITVTVNATLALLRLAAVLGLAASVGAQNPTITVNVNVTGLAGAAAATNAIGAAANRSSVSMGFLAGAIALLILIAIPGLAAIVVALFAIATAAVAAVAAFGVIALAAYGIAKAVQAVSAANEKSGSSAASASAKQAQMASALDSIKTAERGVADAQRQAAKAQADLTRARREAKEANEDLALSARRNAIEQERAKDDLAAAKAAFDAATAPGSGADEKTKREATLAFEEAQLRADELATQGKRLADQKAHADKVGIEGSDQVVAAQERIRDANEQVIASQQQLAAAHRQAAQAAISAGDSGASAASKAADALAALTPQGRAFVRFLFTLRDEIKNIQHAAERGLLPGVQRGLEAMAPLMRPGGPIVTFVERFAGALGYLAETGLKALTQPFWFTFFDWLGTEGLAILVDFVKAIGYVIKGFAAMLVAFGPASKRFSAGLLDMARSFAEWAAKLANTKGFQSFVAYAVEQGPKLLTVLGKLVVIVVRLAVAMAPLAVLTLDGLVIGLSWLARQDPGVILAIAAAIAVLVAVIVGAPAAIVIAVVAVTALLVHLYQRFEWFRDGVNAIWAAIVAYVKFIYEYGYKPVFIAIVFFLTKVLAPAWTWLWQYVIKPVWNAIAAASVWLWENVLKPIFNGIVFLITKILGPIFVWLYEHVISPIWKAISLVIKINWAIIQVIFGLIQIAVKIVAAIFVWLWDNVLRPIWNGFVALIQWVWEKIRPVFETFGGFIEKNVAPAFSRGVTALGNIWNGFKELAKAPIRFVVQTILNDGLLAAYNWIAKKFGVKPDDVRVPVPDWLASSSSSGGGGGGGKHMAMAAGGLVSGPGTGTSDDILARLSNGEYVIPAWVVRTFGVSFFDWLIGKQGKSMSRGQKPGDGSEGLAFADGGLVGWVKSAWTTLTDPIGALKKKAGEALGAMPGGAWVRSVLTGLATSTIGRVVDALGRKITNLMTADGWTGPISADVAAVQQWVRAQDGKPYIWAGAGPAGYDCSGIVSAVWNALHSKYPYAHTFSTSSQAPYFPKLNQVGILTSGWSHAGERGGGSVGHTAANLAGLPFESTGSRGVHVGLNNGVTPYTAFARWGTFDAGGMLMPGLTLAYNGTGGPERILTEAQWREITHDGGSGGAVTYETNIYPQRANLTVDDLDAVFARRAALARVRRPS